MTQEELERRAAEVGLLYDLSHMGDTWNPAAGAFGADNVQRFLFVSEADNGTSLWIDFQRTIHAVLYYMNSLMYEERDFVAVHDLESENYLTPLPVKIHVTVSGLPDEDEA